MSLFYPIGVGGDMYSYPNQEGGYGRFSLESFFSPVEGSLPTKSNFGTLR